MSTNFHLKRFHISRDTSEIVLHVIKQCLQACYYHRNRFSKKLMVSARVSWNGKTKFFIDPQKTKVNQKTYIDFLKMSLLPECHRLYPDNDFVFMQDSAPSHSAKATQNFLRDNTSDFISSQEWTPHSPDLNQLGLDYSLWDILQELVYEGRRESFANLKDLQNVIRGKWHDVNNQTVRKAILQWKRRLAAVAKQNGGLIQHVFCWSVDWYELLWRSGLACVQPAT